MNKKIVFMGGAAMTLGNITPAAEHSWALLMALACRLPNSTTSVKNGLWNREDFPSIMLNGKTIGIVGCGRIGQWMGRYGNAFGMNVIAYYPKVKSSLVAIFPASNSFCNF